MGTVILLGHTFAENVFQVVVTQGLFELGFSGRIDALSDDDRIFADLHCLCKRGNHSTVLFRNRNRLFIPAAFCHHADMLRRGATAAAHNAGTHIHDFFYGLCEMRRIDIVNGLSILASWKTCIRVDHHWSGRNLQNILQDFFHLNRTKSAVHAQNIHAKAL